ncbi:hypothetical protein [Floridanema aerugineum]|jgi:hypothetical protein|uniref:Uncharacterized protein n=1 Tax=Floridaenema aerugineum BLCC-F46 TaxID=3153654 RepID=A0ABV4XAX3_9CYAN
MPEPKLEERIAQLEAEVAHLKSLISPSSTTSNPWWLKITGTFANSKAFEEAMQLGKEYRQSQQEDDEQRIPPYTGGIVSLLHEKLSQEIALQSQQQDSEQSSID